MGNWLFGISENGKNKASIHDGPQSYGTSDSAHFCNLIDCTGAA